MKKIKINKRFGLEYLAILSVVLSFFSCNENPAGDTLYTFTGETIESFLAKDSDLTSFNYILSRVGLDKTMATYGEYTCFAPTNDAVNKYLAEKGLSWDGLSLEQKQKIVYKASFQKFSRYRQNCVNKPYETL